MRLLERRKQGGDPLKKKRSANMKRKIQILVTLLVVYVGFLYWHSPTGGPLTDEEVDAFMEHTVKLQGSGWAMPADFEAFLRSDDGRSFVMINLLEFSEAATYEAGTFPEIKTGDQASFEYGRRVVPLLLARGSYPITIAERYNTIINSLGQKAGNWDSLAIVRYRSRRDLIDMIQSDAFVAAEVHKWAALDNTLVAPADLMPSTNLGYYAIVGLLMIATIVGYWPTRDRRVF